MKKYIIKITDNTGNNIINAMIDAIDLDDARYQAEEQLQEMTNLTIKEVKEEPTF